LESLARDLLDHEADVLAVISSENTAVWSCPAAREHYLERLGIADDSGLDAGPGSPAQANALREARRVAAGLPPTWSGTRGRESIDVIIDAFGPVSFVGHIDAQELAPVWMEPVLGSSPDAASNPGHGGIHPDNAPRVREALP
jgi:hypothetical protein